MTSRKKFVKRVLVGLSLLLLSFILIWAGHLVYRIVHLSQTARGLISSAQAEDVDVSAIKPAVFSVVDDLHAIQVNVRPIYPLLNFCSGLPIVGSTLAQIEPLLNFAGDLSQAGGILFSIFEPVLGASSPASNSGSATERLMNAIQNNAGFLDEAERLVNLAAGERKRITPTLLPDSVQKYFALLDQYFPALQKGFPVIKLIPGLLGAAEKQNFLVLAQNRDEMRPTGGFISGIGLVSMENGIITSFSIGDSYSVDDYTKNYPAPPAPLKQFMLADYWVPRDANWSPDFPTSALKVQELYSLSTGIQTQGVLAFDQLAVKGILEVIGPVSLDGYPEPITAATVEDFMRQSWAPDPKEGITPEWWVNRKKFMGLLGKEIIGKFFTLRDQKTLLQLVQVSISMVKSGHLLIFFNDPDMAALLAETGMDGGIQPAEGDFLYLVDSNVGFNKVDSIVSREILYQVDLSDPKNPSAQISVRYQHTYPSEVTCKQEASYGNGTYADMQARCYWDYWRIYGPSGSQLISSNVSAVPGKMLLKGKDWPAQVETGTGENGLKVYSGLMVLPAHSQQQTLLKISLPASIVRKEESGIEVYSLRLQKQPGLESLPVKVQIKIPPNATITPGYTDWQKEGSDAWVWQGVLTGRRELSLAFSIAP